MRTVAFLLATAGAVHLWIVAQGHESALHFLPGFLEVAVGAGLWLRARWARWFALGACFIAIVGACVVPVFCFLFRRHSGLEDAFAANLWSSGLALFMGVLGYLALGYLRSDAGRLEYGGDDAEETGSTEESSASIIWSALAWIAVFGLASFGGMATYTPTAAKPPAPVRTQGVRDLPDLVPMGLCMTREERPELKLVYANLGRGANDLKFDLASADDWTHASRTIGQDLNVPAPGATLTTSLGRDAEEERESIVLVLDREKRVPEISFDNNAARFRIPRDGNGRLAAPSCDAVHLRPPGPQERAARQGLPNLVPIGLCARGGRHIEVRFTNLGGPSRAALQTSVAWTRFSRSYAVQDRIPNYREIGSAEVTVPDRVRMPANESLDIVVELDSPDAIKESDEADNRTQVRITWLWDGNIALNDCGFLQDRFYRAALPAYTPPPPPAEKLPDLIPLGLCYGSGIQLVIGNIGTAKGSTPVSVTGQIRGKSARPVIGELQFTPWPQAVGKISMGVEYSDVPSQLAVELDPRSSIPELNEANNSASFDIGRRENGNPDLPDCTLVDVRVDKWVEPKTASKRNQ